MDATENLKLRMTSRKTEATRGESGRRIRFDGPHATSPRPVSLPIYPETRGRD